MTSKQNDAEFKKIELKVVIYIKNCTQHTTNYQIGSTVVRGIVLTREGCPITLNSNNVRKGVPFKVNEQSKVEVIYMRDKENNLTLFIALLAKQYSCTCQNH